MRTALRIATIATLLPLSSALAAEEAATYLLSGPPVNTIDITLDVTLGTNSQTRTDTTTAQLTGDATTLLSFDYGPAEITGLQFTGGTVAVNDLALTFFWFLVGTVDITSSNVLATFTTPSPPGPVTNGTFNLGDHLATAYAGEVRIAFKGLILGFLPDIVLDLDAEPFSATFATNLPITLVSGPVSGDQATFSSTISVPVVYSDDVFTNATLDIAATITGTIEGTSTFDITLPPASLTVDADSLPLGPLEVSTPAEPGTEYLIEMSENMTFWTPVASGMATSSVFTYSDTNAPMPSTRAYRFVIP